MADAPPHEDDDRLNDAQLLLYLQRIQYPHDPSTVQPNRDTLDAIIKAHVSSIPYENLDLHYQRPGSEPPVCSIRLPSTFDKMVTNKRGGYCLELNCLLAQALRALGLRVTTHQARMVFDISKIHQREGDAASKHNLGKIWPTHLLLTVTMPDGERRLADVGLAKYSMIESLLLSPHRDGQGQAGSDGGAIARGILGKQFRLVSTIDAPDGEHLGDSKAFYVQVSIPCSEETSGAPEAAKRHWQDYYYFADKSAGREGEDYVHLYMSKGPESVAPLYPFATMAARGVGQVSIQDGQLIIRKAQHGASEDQVVMKDETMLGNLVSKQRLHTLQEEKDAMLKYFGIPNSYAEPPRVRVECKLG